MSAPPAIRQSTITRAIKAAKAAGIEVGRVEVTPDGGVTIFATEAEPESDDRALEQWTRQHGSRHS